MKVKIGQFELDTNEMSAYTTGVPTLPVIFVSQNGAAFVQSTRPHWPEPRIRYVGRAEARRLADYYRIASLKERLGRSVVSPSNLVSSSMDPAASPAS
jgi:hypothetical protein